MLISFSFLQAQTLSGYTGSTSLEDGYVGKIKRVTIKQTNISSSGQAEGAQNTSEIKYDDKGRRISLKENGHTTEYKYESNSFTVTTDGRIAAKAFFNNDGSLKEYVTYNSKGSVLRKDIYTQGQNGAPMHMRRTDGQGADLSSWFYTTDGYGNTVVKNQDDSVAYTFSPEGILLEEFISNGGNSWSEKKYDYNGFESSVRIFSFPETEMIIQRDIPTTEITYESTINTDEHDRIKELSTASLTKQKEKWFDESGNYVSSEERRKNNISLSWLTYRYDGQLIELHTEHWTAPTEDNPTGYSSITDEYFYNNKDQLTQIVSFDQNGNESERISFTYDDEGLLLSSDAENEPDEKNFYSWNENKQMASKLCYIEDDSLFFAGIEEYYYNDDGSSFKTEYTQIWKINLDEQPERLSQFSSKSQTLFYYNPQGLLSKKESSFEDRKETEFYDYDGEERIILTSIITEYPDGTKLYGEKTYKYEGDIDYTKMTEYDSHYTKKVYTYNDKGNISSIKEYETRYIDGSYIDTLYSISEYTYN